MKTSIAVFLCVFVICITSKTVAQNGAKKKGVTGGRSSSGLKITEVVPDELQKLITDNEYLLVYFYDNDGVQSQISKQVKVYQTVYRFQNLKYNMKQALLCVVKFLFVYFRF